ncbi:AcrR family transcriptional regulator [Rhodobium orientis]|nr:TetR/AcrR family transcriptional regulator [Rhodobium orientis]MBB4305250.1 AcrR family transcriptional regulator [Rhodobium orientis]
MPDNVQRGIIIEQAHELFLANGYGGTTMDQIAGACRVSKRTLYRLFPGKLDLFAAIIDKHRQRMLLLPGDYDDMPLDLALETIFRVEIDPDDNRRRQALIRLVIIETRQYPELHTTAREYGAIRARRELADWLDRQCACGRLEIDDTEAAAQMLLDMVFGAMAAKVSGAELDWPGENDREGYIRRCIQVFLHGVQTRESVPA